MCTESPSSACLCCRAKWTNNSLTMVRSLIQTPKRKRGEFWHSATVECIRFVEEDNPVSDDLWLRLCREARSTCTRSPFFTDVMAFSGARLCIIARQWGRAKSGLDGLHPLYLMEAVCQHRGIDFTGTRRLMKEGMECMRCAGGHAHAMFMLALCVAVDMSDDLSSCLEGLDLFRRAHELRHRVGSIKMDVTKQIRTTVLRVLIHA